MRKSLDRFSIWVSHALLVQMGVFSRLGNFKLFLGVSEKVNGRHLYLSCDRHVTCPGQVGSTLNGCIVQFV